MIDVVSDSETICKIQMSSERSAAAAVLKNGVLASWLKKHNKARQLLITAVTLAIFVILL